MKKIILLASALALMGAPVFAQQQNCNTREVVTERLQGQFSEGVHARGLAPNGQAIVEVWGSAETGTWTITVTNPAGITCLVASGQSFETVTPEPIVQEDDPA